MLSSRRDGPISQALDQVFNLSFLAAMFILACGASTANLITKSFEAMCIGLIAVRTACSGPLGTINLIHLIWVS